MSDFKKLIDNMDPAVSIDFEKDINEDIHLDSNIILETIPSSDGEVKEMEKSYDQELPSEYQDVQSNEIIIKGNMSDEFELLNKINTSQELEDHCSKDKNNFITESGNVEKLNAIGKFEMDISKSEFTTQNDISKSTNQENELKFSVDHNKNIFYDSSINTLSDNKAEVNEDVKCDSKLHTLTNENETIASEDISKINLLNNLNSTGPVLNDLKDTKLVCDGDQEKAQQLEDSELTESERFVDILGNGLLTKRIIIRGLGRETRPTHGDSVTIQYKGWNTNGDLIDNNEVSFVLGDGDMIQAFDLGICLAERHEEFELKTDARFAFGNYGWEPLVKPNEALTYRIKLLRVDDPPEYATFTHQDRLEAADVKRERGNYLYRREEYSLAVNSYSRAIKIIETDPDYKRISTDQSKADMFDIFVKVTNNLAAAQLKLESYDNVVETCNTILSYDSSNVKALFRKGKSLTMKGNYDEAIPILKRALELENSKLIASELQRSYQLKRAEDEQRARVCRKMFGTGVKETVDKSIGNATASSSWKKMVFKYSPYIGAVFITGVSVMLASIAIAKSKGN